MTAYTACPVCATPDPDHRVTTQPRCCSIACYRLFHGPDQPRTPSRHDAVTMACPVCQHTFVPVGRQKFCSDACKAAAYRRRRDTRPPSLVVPTSQPRPPITIYECDTCNHRSLGQQRCPDCATFMRKLGLGGNCPCCDEPITVAELVGQEVNTSR